MSYTELSMEERVTIQIGQYRDLSQREIARLLGRSPSTISRAAKKSPSHWRLCGVRSTSPYSRASKVCCPARKLVPGNELFELITHLLRERFSQNKSRASCVL